MDSDSQDRDHSPVSETPQEKTGGQQADEQAGHAVLLAEAIEVGVNEWSKDIDQDDAGMLLVQDDDLDRLIGALTAKLATEGFGRR